MNADAIERRLQQLYRQRAYQHLLEDRRFLRQLDFSPEQQAIYESRVRRINERYEYYLQASR